MSDVVTPSALDALKSKLANGPVPYFVSNASQAIAIRDALRVITDDCRGDALPVGQVARIGALLDEARNYLAATTVSLSGITAGVDGVDAITVFEAGSYSGVEISLAGAAQMIAQAVPGVFPEELDAVTVSQVYEVGDQLEVAHQVGQMLAA